MGGLNSSYTAETAVYSAHSLVKGDPEWRIIAANGWQDNWPVYSRPYGPRSWYTISNMVNSKIQTNGS